MRLASSCLMWDIAHRVGGRQKILQVECWWEVNVWQHGAVLWSPLVSCKGQQNYFCPASTRKMEEAQASWTNEGGKWNTQEIKIIVFFYPSFLRSLQSCALARSLCLCWLYLSLPSITFESWCFLEELRSQECLSRGLKMKERPCSPYYGKRWAQCLLNRKASVWEGESGWMSRLWKCFS